MPAFDPPARRVVVTGLGVVSCAGIGKDAFWRAVRDGVSGIRRITRFDVSDLNSQIAGEITDFEPTDWVEEKKSRKQGRFVHFAVAAAKLALQDSGLDLSTVDPFDVGVAFGASGAGNGNIADDHYTRWVQSDFRKVDPTGINEIPTHAASSHISIELGIKGPQFSISTGCVTSVLTVGQALETLCRGQAKYMIAGGAEACLSRPIYHMLARQRVMSTRNDDPQTACRPFDRHSDGLVLGEGAGAVMLETADQAMKRGAHIYGEVVGYAVNTEAYHMVISIPTGEEMSRCLKGAAAMARIAPHDIDYICAHGIGNSEYDLADTRGVKLALGRHAYHIPVSSIKPIPGQCFGAGAAMQLVAVCMTMETETVPPTINLTDPSPECDLDYVPEKARRSRVDTVAFNAHSFGGTHAAMIVSRFSENGN